MPDEWLPVLDAFRPTSHDLHVATAPFGPAILDEAFQFLKERQFEVLFKRYGQKETLAEVGEDYSLTRERVRQIEKVALKRIRTSAVSFQQAFTELTDEIADQDVVIYRLPEEGSQYFTEADSEQLLQTAVGIWEKLNGKRIALRQLSPGKWAFFSPRHFRKEAMSVQAFMNAEPRFLQLEEIADFLDVEPYNLAHTWELYDKIYLTRNGYVGSTGWTKLACHRAAAVLLTDAGFEEWHFSELFHAASYLFPEKFSGAKSRNTAAMLSRPDVTAFQFGGRKGYWRKAIHGDGHIDNKAAVTALLEATDLPMHARHIHSGLTRTVRRETVDALLSRDLDFRSFGGGVYGLVGKVYQDEHSELEWLQGYMGANDSIEAAAVEADALTAGLDPVRLEGAVALSGKFRRVRRASSYPATYQREDYFRIRRFQRWYRHRAAQPPPAQEVLLLGIQTAIAERDHKLVLKVRDALSEHGVAASDELAHLFALAESFAEA